MTRPRRIPEIPISTPTGGRRPFFDKLKVSQVLSDLAPEWVCERLTAADATCSGGMIGKGVALLSAPDRAGNRGIRAPNHCVIQTADCHTQQPD